MILHLLQWYLLIGCVVMGIAILLILVSGNGAWALYEEYEEYEENDESRADVFIGMVISYFIWPYYVITYVKVIKTLTKEITK
jgi:hypothetical protein|nr:MAG TPA: hypothetical protein [Caudoviricetes sp.]